MSTPAKPAFLVQYEKASQLFEAGRLENCLAGLKKILNSKPDFAPAHYLAGAVYRARARYPLALAHCRKACSLDPDNYANWHNLATLEQVLGNFIEAEAAFANACERNPLAYESWKSLGMAMMRNGNLLDGAKAYETRLQTKEFAKTMRFAAPRWHGQVNPQATLLLHSEQGLGDSIQFIRFVKDVRPHVGRIVVACQPPLQTLFASIDGIDQVLRPGDALPKYDYHCPLPSLGFALGLDLAQLEAAGGEPYLKADPELSKIWAQRLGPKPAGKRCRIGICWQGNPKNDHDAFRRIDPSLLKPLFDLPDIDWVSLQVGGDRAQIDPVLERARVFDPASYLKDFAETAALIDNLDMVVSACTSVAHLAGALGKDLRVLLPINADWRWFKDRSDSPYYRSAKLYRQPSQGDWKSVIKALAQDLCRKD